MMYRKIATAAVVFTALTSFILPASAQVATRDSVAGMTEQQVIQAFMRHQRMQQWLDSQKSAIDAERQGAALLSNPEAEIVYEPMTFDDGSEENETAIWLTQRFAAWGARAHRQQAADYKALAESADMQIKVRDQLTGLRLDLYHLKLLQARYFAHQQWVEQLAGLVSMSEQQVAAGEQSKLAHFRLQQELSAARLTLIDIEQQVIGKSAELEQVTGMAIVDIAEPLLPAHLNHETLNTLSPPTETPELRLLSAQQKQLEAQGAAARSKALPEVSVGVGLRQIDNSQGSHSEAAFQVGVELPLFERGQYQSARYEQLLSAVAIEHERARQALLQRFGMVKGQLKAALAGVKQAQLPNVDTMLKTATEAYWLGEISVSELIDIQSTQIELSEQQLTQEFAARKYWITLQALLQQPMENLR
ncbi:TolC family protein [Pseudidiomarina salinarum]|nr:TolC family protein [Pseudidiomarina salinarum]